MPSHILLNRAEACGAQSSPGDWLRVENHRETLPYGDRPLILCTEKPRPLERGDPLLWQIPVVSCDIVAGKDETPLFLHINTAEREERAGDSVLTRLSEGNDCECVHVISVRKDSCQMLHQMKWEPAFFCPMSLGKHLLCLLGKPNPGTVWMDAQGSTEKEGLFPWGDGGDQDWSLKKKPEKSRDRHCVPETAEGIQTGQTDPPGPALQGLSARKGNRCQKANVLAPQVIRPFSDPAAFSAKLTRGERSQNSVLCVCWGRGGGVTGKHMGRRKCSRSCFGSGAAQLSPASTPFPQGLHPTQNFSGPSGMRKRFGLRGAGARFGPQPSPHCKMPPPLSSPCLCPQFISHKLFSASLFTGAAGEAPRPCGLCPIRVRRTQLPRLSATPSSRTDRTCTALPTPTAHFLGPVLFAQSVKGLGPGRRRRAGEQLQLRSGWAEVPPLIAETKKPSCELHAWPPEDVNASNGERTWSGEHGFSL
ncbi:hypothetical protein Cadr_000030167 [Camelus dromedarius]|uniref:Uncharacterized protein n=1 Tax=Camelus dromedarius TaxID=9838 RepID=A0A5N4BZY5_CAMDR|nr:hypothetical protein Cadr_000030167 [Camelus dromedarius]